MSETAAVQPMVLVKDDSERKHRFRILLAWIISMGFVGIFASYGLDYYALPSTERPFSPKHFLLRPSGPIGVNLGLFGVLMFFVIYLYPLRKRWGWLGRRRRQAVGLPARGRDAPFQRVDHGCENLERREPPVVSLDDSPRGVVGISLG